jgi:hypothetical protein
LLIGDEITPEDNGQLSYFKMKNRSHPAMERVKEPF